MLTSIVQIIGGLSVVITTTAVIPVRLTSVSAPAAAQGVISTAMPTPAGPGLPADFPLAPGLSACKPIVSGGEIICEWHGVNGHAIYTFYHEALPKAGYTLLPGAQEVLTPHYLGAIGFKKGSAQGAVTIAGGDLTIQYLPHQ